MPSENVVGSDVVDINGWTNCSTKDGKASITVLGGYLAQMMIVFNTICREFLFLDKPGAVTKVGGKGSKAQPADRPKSQLSSEAANTTEAYER